MEAGKAGPRTSRVIPLMVVTRLSCHGREGSRIGVVVEVRRASPELVVMAVLTVRLWWAGSGSQAGGCQRCRKLLGLVQTQSPGPTSRAMQAMWSAEVALLTATA